MSLTGGVAVFFGCDITELVHDGDFLDMDFVGLSLSIDQNLKEKLDKLNLDIRATYPNYQKTQRIFLESLQWEACFSEPITQSSIFTKAHDLPPESLISQMKEDIQKGIQIIAKHSQIELFEDGEPVYEGLQESAFHMIAFCSGNPNLTHSSPDTISFYGEFRYGVDISAWFHEHSLFDSKRVRNYAIIDSCLFPDYQTEEALDEDTENLLGYIKFQNGDMPPHSEASSPQATFVRIFKSGTHQPFDVDFVNEYSVHGEFGDLPSAQETADLQKKIEFWQAKICQHFDIELPPLQLQLITTFECMDTAEAFNFK